jgi:adenylate cyclase
MPDQTTSVGMERKLAAIFSTDVAGYSRLMGDDEEATIRTLTAYRAVISSLVQQYRGRVVDSPGDNLLAEFASVVDAVHCAVEIQHALKEKNAELPEHRQMQFRIGINLGDVIVEGERLYGDGVNIAARLESLAIPGGVCISGTVYDHVKNKVALGYEYLGEREVKNIAEPVRVYRVKMDEESGSAVGAALRPQEVLVGRGRPQDGQPHRVAPTTAHKRKRLMAVAGLLLIAATIGVVRYWPSPTPNSQLLTPNPQLLTPNTQLPPLPDKPSLVVLPFINMSEDSKQDYFSDGITEDLTTALSQIASLFVIARNSAFTYKGKAVKVQEVGKELGVQYVLEGSVRRASDQVRITAQLIDATTGYHLWSERYDRPLKDIFALQDEIVQKIVTTLKLQLTLREQGYLVHKTTNNLEAYDAYLRGIEFYNRATQETNIQARQLFEKAITLDPQYAEAYMRLSRVLATEWVYQWSRDPQTLERALVLAQKAVALDDSLSGAHEALAYAYLYKRQHEQAIAAAERTITLAPNDSEGAARLGLILNFAGRPDEAIGLIKKAMRLNPRYPHNYLSQLGMAYGLTGRYEEALATLRSATIRNPDHLPPHLHLALSYSELSRDTEARAEVAELLRISPNYSLEGFMRVMPFKNPAELERYLAALRKAGLK